MPMLVAMLTACMAAFALLHVHEQQLRKSGGATARLATRSATLADVTDMQESLQAIHHMHGRKSSQATAAQPALDVPDPMCNPVAHAEYDGDTVVAWGNEHLQPTAGECCTACTLNPDCNVWVWCSDSAACGSGKRRGECWLKHSHPSLVIDDQAYLTPDSGWVSGAVFMEAQLATARQQNAQRLAALKADPANPLVYLEVSIRGAVIGRVVISLFAKASPRAAENFRQLATGEAGVVPPGLDGAGLPYSLKGIPFYRIVDRFICQAGANIGSVFGGAFKDDVGGLALKHDRRGLLSMANSGPDTNTAHFSVLMAPAPHLDGHYTIFGEVVEGMHVMDQVNSLARIKPNHQAGAEEQAVISDCGQLAGPTKIAVRG